MNDRLCYEVDVNELIDKSTLKKDFKKGLMFLIDQNEDRQVFNTEDKSENNDFLQLGKLLYSFYGKTIFKKLDFRYLKIGKPTSPTIPKVHQIYFHK